MESITGKVVLLKLEADELLDLSLIIWLGILLEKSLGFSSISFFTFSVGGSSSCKLLLSSLFKFLFGAFLCFLSSGSVHFDPEIVISYNNYNLHILNIIITCFCHLQPAPGKLLQPQLLPILQDTISSGIKKNLEDQIPKLSLTCILSGQVQMVKVCQQC